MPGNTQGGARTPVFRSLAHTLQKPNPGGVWFFRIVGDLVPWTNLASLPSPTPMPCFGRCLFSQMLTESTACPPSLHVCMSATVRATDGTCMTRTAEEVPALLTLSEHGEDVPASLSLHLPSLSPTFTFSEKAGMLQTALWGSQQARLHPTIPRGLTEDVPSPSFHLRPQAPSDTIENFV